MGGEDDMTHKHTYIAVLALALILLGILAGCSEKRDGVPAKITFSRFYYEKSGRQAAISSVFALKDGENVCATVDPGGYLMDPGHERMFHLDWTDTGGNSVYLKRIDLPAGDSTRILASAISVEPAKRLPGEYTLRIYYFRDLIAEKKFKLVPENEMKKISADIIFYKSIDKETGEMKGIDTVFEIKKKGVLRGQADIRDMNIYEDEELPFRLEWTDSTGESFYTKKVEMKPTDTISSVSTSVSITPDKREPGEYFLRVYLFDEMVGEASFTLISEKIINHKGTKGTKKH